jgi:hypothetical protein
MKTKTADQVAEKWARVTPGRQGDFKAGVSDPNVKWAAPTAAAVGSWNAGVQAAVTKGTFEKGVTKAGDAKWSRKTTDVGVQRWGPGVLAAQPDMAAGWKASEEALSRLTLTPRGPRNDPRNLERVAAVARALAETRNK